MRTVIFAVLLGAACAASAQLYRWTDDQGRVHVTDTPPPPSAKDVRKRAADVTPAAAAVDLPYAVRLAAKDYPVTLYTAPACAPCGAARSLLNRRGVPFSEISVIGQKESDQLRKAVGSLSVPSLVVGTSVQKGFEQGAYEALLDNAGYPRTGILAPRGQTEPKPAPPAPAGDAPPAEEPAVGPYTPR